MKHECSAENIVAALGAGLRFVGRELRDWSILMLMVAVVALSAWLADNPAGFLIPFAYPLISVPVSLALVGIAGYAFYRNRFDTTLALVAGSISFAFLFGFYRYARWVAHVVPNFSSPNPIPVLWVKNVSWAVHVGLLPAQAAIVVLLIGMVVALYAVAMSAFEELCQFGAKVRMQKTQAEK
jgi:hypothetical protein